MFLPYECAGLCRHRPGYSKGKNIKLPEMKNEKKLHFVERKPLISEECFIASVS